MRRDAMRVWRCRGCCGTKRTKPTSPATRCAVRRPSRSSSAASPAPEGVRLTAAARGGGRASSSRRASGYGRDQTHAGLGRRAAGAAAAPSGVSRSRLVGADQGSGRGPAARDRRPSDPWFEGAMRAMSGGCFDSVGAFESNTEAESLRSSSARDRILTRATAPAAA